MQITVMGGFPRLKVLITMGYRLHGCHSQNRTERRHRMIEFILGLIIGLFSGAAIGIGIMAVCAVGKRGDNSDG